MTVSLVRETKPEGLFRYFKEHHFSVKNPYQGIYYIEGAVLFPTQIVVTRELNEREHVWLGALSDRLEKQKIIGLLKHIEQLSEKAAMNEGIKEGIKEGFKKGIQGTVDTLREFGHRDAEIKRAIVNRYALSEEEAEAYLHGKNEECPVS